MQYEHEHEHLDYSLSLQPGLILGPSGLGNNPLMAVIIETLGLLQHGVSHPHQSLVLLVGQGSE